MRHKISPERLDWSAVEAPEAYVSAVRIAELLGVNRCVITRWEKQGLMPALVQAFPNQRAFRHREIVAWIAGEKAKQVT